MPKYYKLLHLTRIELGMYFSVWVISILEWISCIYSRGYNSIEFMFNLFQPTCDPQI